MPNPSSPSWSDFELPDQGKKSVNLSIVRTMIPVKVPMQGLKTLVRRGRNAEDAAHGVILRGALAGGKWVHSCTSHGGLPLLPPMSSLLHDFPPKTQST